MASTTNLERQKNFEDIIARANREFKSELGGPSVYTLKDKPLKVESISTGSLVLDSLLGGGLPKGRICEIYGPEGSGKTSIALTAAGNIQRSGGTVLFVDLEHAFDPLYARKLGVDVDSLGITQPDYAEQALDMVEMFAKSGTVDMIIVDSVAALVPKAEMEASMEKESMGTVAKMLSRHLRGIISVANNTGTTIVYINQIREKIGVMFGSPETTTGGRALKFYSSARIDVRRRGQVKEGAEIIGNEVQLKIVKLKTAPPFGVGQTVLTFNKGINKAAEIIQVGEDYGIISKPAPSSKSFYEVETGELISSGGKAKAISAIENDPALLERLTTSLANILEAQKDGLDPVVDEEDGFDGDIED
jgi:recombination protein RecA